MVFLDKFVCRMFGFECRHVDDVSMFDVLSQFTMFIMWACLLQCLMCFHNSLCLWCCWVSRWGGHWLQHTLCVATLTFDPWHRNQLHILWEFLDFCRWCAGNISHGVKTKWTFIQLISGYFVFLSLSFTFASSNMILTNIFIIFIPFFCKDTGICMMIKNHSVFKLSIPCFFTIHHYYSPKLFAILTLHYLQLLLFFGQILSCILWQHFCIL